MINDYVKRQIYHLLEVLGMIDTDHISEDWFVSTIEDSDSLLFSFLNTLFISNDQEIIKQFVFCLVKLLFEARIPSPEFQEVEVPHKDPDGDRLIKPIKTADEGIYKDPIDIDLPI